MYLPLNPITENLWYTDEADKNMRMVISARTNHPIVFTLTKVENTSPLGIQTLTFYQNFWNDHTDYIERDDSGNIIGMWTNYFDTTTPIDPDTSAPTPSPETNVTAFITSTASTIKVAGSYKTLNLAFYNESNKDISSDFENADITWNYSINDTTYRNVIEKVVSYNQRMIKLPEDYNILGKILTISCTIAREDIGYIYSEKFQMSITE